MATFNQPCWPDVIEHAKNALPGLGVVTAILAYPGLVVLLLWAPKVRKKWMRVCSRLLGALGVLSIIISLPVVVLGTAFAWDDPPTKRVVVRSSGGEEATLNYSAGFLGRDYTEVVVKHPDSCRHLVVFWHAGPSELKDVQMDWTDDRHLRLSYHTRPSDPQYCETLNGNISIVCAASRWPE